MRRGRFTEEQIIKVLKEHAAGASASDLCRKHGISNATFYKWRSRYGGMEISDARKSRAFQGSRSLGIKNLPDEDDHDKGFVFEKVRPGGQPECWVSVNKNVDYRGLFHKFLNLCRAMRS
jgi:putative transposase